MKKSKAFTLIELLIVISIIAVIATAMIIAVNPGQRLAEARDNTREVHLKTTKGAVDLYRVSNGHYPFEITEIMTEICNTNLASPDCNGLVDLSVLNFPIPVDPQGSDNPNGTGYEIAVQDGRVMLNALKAQTRTVAIGDYVPPPFDPETYCQNNQGPSTLNGYTVWCDSHNNMWTETLNTGMNEPWNPGEGKYGPETLNVNPNTAPDRFFWSSPDNIGIETTYGVTDSNEVPLSELHKFPATNACATLDYAGFTGGWKLPSQDGRDGNWDDYCAPGRQLWDFGVENCNWACNGTQTGCSPAWDQYSVANLYWSSTESSSTSAWRVFFNNGGVSSSSKSTNALRVRCFLGQW